MDTPSNVNKLDREQATLDPHTLPPRPPAEPKPDIVDVAQAPPASDPPDPQAKVVAEDSVVPLVDGDTKVSGVQLGDRGVLLIVESKEHMSSTFIDHARVARAAGALLGNLIVLLVLAMGTLAHAWESNPNDVEWRGEHRFQQPVTHNGPLTANEAVALNAGVTIAGTDVADDLVSLHDRAVWSFAFSASDLLVTTNATDATVIGAIPDGWIIYDALLHVSTAWTSLTNDATLLSIGLYTDADVFAGGAGDGAITNAVWSAAGLNAATIVLNTRSSAILTTNAASVSVHQTDTPSTNGAAKLFLWAVRE